MRIPKPRFDPASLKKSEIEGMASIGCTLPEIAMIMGCNEKTLRRHFGPELKKGRSMGCASLRRMQWELAKKGNATMLIWLGKNLLNQADKFNVTAKDEPGFEFVNP